MFTRNPDGAVLTRVDGWPVHLTDLDNAVAQISRRAARLDDARADRGFTVFTLNLDHLVKLRRNPSFANAYRKADLVTADGAPIVWMGRRAAPQLERTTGADLFVPVAMAAAAQKSPVYLFGATTDVLATTAERLTARSGGRMTLAGVEAPSGNFDPEGPEADAAIARIKASGARLVFVALGAPKQEIFSVRAVERGCKAGFICVGAAVDFVAGTQVRAPKAFQRSGLEWAWRLATNPRRLAGRYADCARLLVDVAVIGPIVGPMLARDF
jgi:exopolysaccharide biosynthesis WecB/TagA/CpsF family protein